MYYNASQNHSLSYKYTTTASSSDVQPQNNFSNKSASSFLLPSTFLSTIAIFLYALGTIISLAVIFCCFWCKYRLCDNSVEQVHGEDHQIGEETNNDGLGAGLARLGCCRRRTDDNDNNNEGVAERREEK